MVKISYSTLEYAAKRLEDRDIEEDIDGENIVILSDVTTDSYVKYCQYLEKYDKTLPCIIAHKSGLIIAEDLPRYNHGAVTGFLVSFFGHIDRETLLALSCWTLIVNGTTRDVVNPDACVKPFRKILLPGSLAADDEGNPYPNVVVEVAISQSFQDLWDKCENYFSPRTDIQYVIAIMIYKRAQYGQALLIYVMDRNVGNIPTIVCSFGTRALSNATIGALVRKGVQPGDIRGVGHTNSAGVRDPNCTVPDLPLYQVSFSTVKLYHGVPGGPPPHLPANITLDLFQVKLCIQ